MRLLAPLVLALVVAGCATPAPPATTHANATPPTNATCFGSCVSVAAFNETNRTETAGIGSMDHTHDYWAGRGRVTMFVMPVQMEPYDPARGAAYQAVADFHPPIGAWVFEGADHVEVTISEPRRHACLGAEETVNGYDVCTDTLGNVTGAGPSGNAPPVDDPTGGPSGLSLRYKHAAASRWIDAGPLAWGKPLSIRITDPRQTDMPHVTSSAWSFEVVSPDAQDQTLVFTAKAELVRGSGAIPLWPGHPDFYADRSARVVLDADGVACDGLLGSGTSCALPDYQKAAPVVAQRLVSYGTRTLYVWINITTVFEADPALSVDDWFLDHANATGDWNHTNVFDTTNHSADKRSHLWILPVDDNGMDSPYAEGSKWSFQLGGALSKQFGSCSEGCADWGAKYHVTAIATNRALDPNAYDMYCASTRYSCPGAPS